VDWAAIRLSLQLAVCTTLILCAVGVPLAYWLAASGWRLKFLVEAVVALPLVLPATVLGFYLLMALGPNAPIGRAYERLIGGRLPFSFTGLLVASVLYSLPFAVRPFTVAFSSIDRRLIEASWCLGVSPLATFFRVVVPLSWTGILTGIILTFAHTMGEFGVVLMVGGNVAGVTRTVSIAIYDDVQALNYEAAGHTALFLLGISFAALALTYALQRRVWVL
jgi:molybdate transport system permease protein